MIIHCYRFLPGFVIIASHTGSPRAGDLCQSQWGTSHYVSPSRPFPHHGRHSSHFFSVEVCTILSQRRVHSKIYHGQFSLMISTIFTFKKIIQKSNCFWLFFSCLVSFCFFSSPSCEQSCVREDRGVQGSGDGGTDGPKGEPDNSGPWSKTGSAHFLCPMPASHWAAALPGDDLMEQGLGCGTQTPG